MFRGLCVAIACGLVSAAHAEPRADPTMGRGVFTGAATPGASSLELDPAALALDSHQELVLSGMLLADHYKIHRQLLDLDTGALSQGPSVIADELGPGGSVEWVKPL